jgi:tight adherence protein B
MAVIRTAVADGSEPLQSLVERLAAAASAGGPLEPVWRGAAERLDSAGLHAVAEAWGLTERRGAPVVDVLETLVGALRDQARAEAAVATALAAPRATATLLGALPLGGVVLGEMVGVHPLSVLIGTPAGRVAGAMGLLATIGGRLWMRRLVASVLQA